MVCMTTTRAKVLPMAFTIDGNMQCYAALLLQSSTGEQLIVMLVLSPLLQSARSFMLLQFTKISGWGRASGSKPMAYFVY